MENQMSAKMKTQPAAVRKPAPGLYWVAIRGPAVPSWPLPVSVAAMRQATVHVGRNGEQTLWLFPSADGEPLELPGVRSNYDVLIGYRTRERQCEAVALFLSASIEIAETEARRAMREEVILRPRKR
jgi:hypothetical protein